MPLPQNLSVPKRPKTVRLLRAACCDHRRSSRRPNTFWNAPVVAVEEPGTLLNISVGRNSLNRCMLLQNGLLLPRRRSNPARAVRVCSMTFGFAERIARLLFLGAGLALLSGGPAAAVPIEFTDEEIARIASHGPWPPDWRGDPGNRASGNPAAIWLGQSLFFDARLSANGRVSCAACHRPRSGFQDGRLTARGLARGTRNTPGLLNVRHQRWFGWDGGHDNLWSASLRPILDPREMGGSAARGARLLKSSPSLACHYREAFGKPPSADDPDFLPNLAKAIAAWQETLVSPPTPFDRFREALTDKDAAAAASYPQAARRGLRLFLGRR